MFKTVSTYNIILVGELNMDMDRMVKVVYIDNGQTKVLKGTLFDEDIHTISIKIDTNNKTVVIGKRALTKVTYLDEAYTK